VFPDFFNGQARGRIIQRFVQGRIDGAQFLNGNALLESVKMFLQLCALFRRQSNERLFHFGETHARNLADLHNFYKSGMGAPSTSSC
jgi:hypothetical protein